MPTRRQLLHGLSTATIAGSAGLRSSRADGGESSATTSGEPALPDSLCAMTALELSAAIHRREVSCLEVLDAYWTQLQRFNPVVNAIVSMPSYDTLRAEAAQRDQELARGRSRGWLHGMPCAPKDLTEAKGLVNSSGSPLFAHSISTQDDIHIGRMRAAGALFIGKTNVPEFGLGSQSYNPVFGVTGNAYDPALTAGGSSGGAASALALQLLPTADGSDLMGSLRNPAAFNNVIGFRPTPGLVPSSDRFTEELVCNGPMGRTVSDTARLLATLAGHDPASPTSLPLDPLVFTAPLGRDWSGARVGWLGDFDGYLAMEPGLLAHCERAFGSFDALGCTVDEARPDFSLAELWAVWLTFRHWLTRGWALPLYEDPAQRAQLKPELRWEIEGGAALSGDDITHASQRRGAWYQALQRLFERFDFLALPTTQVYPFDKTIHWPQAIDDKAMDTYHRWMEIVVPGTLSGCPVLNVSVGLGENRLPAGIQLIGRRYGDQALLSFGYAYEQASRFNLAQGPPLLTGR